MGTAIAEIRDNKLYRATHNTLEAYLLDRWEISRSRGYQLIDAARVSTIVDTVGLPAPTNEAQARELSGLNVPQVLAAWGTAVELGNGRPTAAHVAAARGRTSPVGGTSRSVPDQDVRPTRRAPLPDKFRALLWDTTKRANSLIHLAQDDRWAANISTIRIGNRADLGRLIESLQRLHAALEPIGQDALPDVDVDPAVPDENRISSSPMVAPTGKHVVITVESNTAVVAADGYIQSWVRAELDALDVRHQRSRLDKTLIQCPARSADDLAAALEMRGCTVEVRR